MFTKLLHRAMHQPHPSPQQNGSLTAGDLDLRIALHCGIPQTASTLTFDPVQRLLAVGTLDGRIKIIGGKNIEGLLISPKKLPYKFLQFFCNQGFLIGVSNQNEIQVWNLKNQHMAHSLQWESNITALAVIHGTCLMYVGDDDGLISILKYDGIEERILKLPYCIAANAFNESIGLSLPEHLAVVGILPQPFTSGNRVLIAYENGVMILWDISEDQIIALKGHTSLQLKSEEAVGSPVTNQNTDDLDPVKEICSLCWASKSGSIVAVGYIDGDILLWNVSSKSKKEAKTSNDVVKLQLSLGVRRLPVIVLHWSPDAKSNNDCSGYLFIYGGEEMGSEEALTVLHLDWPSGAESVNCVTRIDLPLSGPFADMVLIPENGISQISSTLAAFVLTSPGHLHVYDGSILSNSKAEMQRYSAQPENFPLVVPTTGPCMTVSKICPVASNRIILKALLEKASKHDALLLSGGTKWPLTGGVSGNMSSTEDVKLEKIYMAGYQDGSIRIWDATYPFLTPMLVLEGEIGQLEGFSLVGQRSPITALDFCSTGLVLAAGNDSGLVCIYTIKESIDELNIHLLTGEKLEVHPVPNKGTINCTAVISVVNSPVQALQFVPSGVRLVVGFKCGRVLVTETESLSVLFDVNYSPGPNSGIISLSTETISVPSMTPKPSSGRDQFNLEKEVLFILTKDAHVIVADGIAGNMISVKPVFPKKDSTAVSLHILGRSINNHNIDPNLKAMPKGLSEETDHLRGEKSEVETQVSSELSSTKESIAERHLLVCCEHTLRLYLLKSVLEGEKKCLKKVKLEKTCCWATTFQGQADKADGIALLYQTGDLEIRSVPGLEVLEKNSLMSILRWGYKTNMERTLSSCGDGQISLVNGCELAFLSVLACESGFRIPDNMPSLHDEVLATAAHAAIGFSFFNKKKQDATTSGFLGGIIKGFKGTRAGETDDNTSSSIISFVQQLENHFSRVPFSNSGTTVTNVEKELNIDDIEIDDPHPVVSSSSHNKHVREDAKKEREKLLEGAASNSKPRLRTPEEILTQYKFGGDANAAAAHARDKLVERQEKLQRAQERSEELRNNAQDFESLAKDLAKAMEKKKFWKF